MCAVCKLNVHKRCAKNVANNCGINTKDMAKVLQELGISGDKFSTASKRKKAGCSVLLLLKSKQSKRSIAVSDSPHHYGNSRAIWDHTVLPATRQRWHSRHYPSRSWYSIKWPRRDARLSWPSWLITTRDGIPARRRSPIPVVTGPDVR